MKGQRKQRLTKRKDQDWYKYELGTTQWQIKKHCVWRDRKRTASESEMEPSLGDGRCAPPSFPSRCVPCQRGLWWPEFVCRHLAPVPDTSTLVWQEATLQLAHLTMAVWEGVVCFRKWGFLMMQSSCACVRACLPAFGSLHLFPHVHSLHSLLSARW